MKIDTGLGGLWYNFSFDKAEQNGQYLFVDSVKFDVVSGGDLGNLLCGKVQSI